MDSNKFVFTKIATEELNKIFDYISSDLANPKASKDLYNKLCDVIENMIVFPESYSLVKNNFARDKNVRKAIIDNYLLYYHYDKENHMITILRFVYAKRDLDKLINPMNI